MPAALPQALYAMAAQRAWPPACPAPAGPCPRPAATQTIRVPEVFHYGALPSPPGGGALRGGGSFIVMEYLDLRGRCDQGARPARLCPLLRGGCRTAARGRLVALEVLGPRCTAGGVMSHSSQGGPAPGARHPPAGQAMQVGSPVEAGRAGADWQCVVCRPRMHPVQPNSDGSWRACTWQSRSTSTRGASGSSATTQ